MTEDGNAHEEEAKGPVAAAAEWLMRYLQCSLSLLSFFPFLLVSSRSCLISCCYLCYTQRFFLPPFFNLFDILPNHLQKRYTTGPFLLLASW